MENYILAKKIVSSKYDKDFIYYPLFVVAIFTLLNKYPNYHKEIEDLFLSTDIYLEDKSLYDIVKDNGIDIGSFDSDEEKMYIMSTCFGTSSQGYTFTLDDKECFILNKNNPFIVCNTKDTSITFILNLFIHEFNHLIKGSINSYKIDNDKFSSGYYLRSGLDITYARFLKGNDTLYEINYHNILDEVINTIQTTEMMEDILILDGVVPDSNIQMFIDKLDRSELKKDFGYELCVKAFRPLWKNSNFKSLIEDNIIDGNLNHIIKRFDEITGGDFFYEMSDILDYLDEIASFHKLNIQRIHLLDRLKKIINIFNRNTVYLYKK